MRSKKLAGVVLTICAIMGAFALAAPATAATADQCGINLVTGHTACFGSADQVNSWAQSDMQTSATAGTAAPAATSYLLGIIYDNSGYGGGSYSFFASSGCNGNHSNWDWEYGTLSTIGWNDRLSSFHSYSNCYTKLYETANYGAGSTYGPYANSSYVGDAMNDQASSIRWY